MNMNICTISDSANVKGDNRSNVTGRFCFYFVVDVVDESAGGVSVVICFVITVS